VGGKEEEERGVRDRVEKKRENGARALRVVARRGGRGESRTQHPRDMYLVEDDTRGC